MFQPLFPRMRMFNFVRFVVPMVHMFLAVVVVHYSRSTHCAVEIALGAVIGLVVGLASGSVAAGVITAVVIWNVVWWAMWFVGQSAKGR